MGTFGRCVGGGRRSAPRETSPLIAVFTTVTSSHSAALIDISKTGARLRGAELPAEDQEVLLSHENVRAFGIVRWVHEDECGIEFDPELDEEDVETLHQRIMSAKGYQPGFKAAMEDWKSGMAR